MKTEFSVHFLVTGAYQNISISYIYIYQLYISYHMNGMRVLTVKSAVSGDRVQCSFLSDRSLSNISISYIYIYQLYISYHMNSVRVLSVKSAVSGDRVQCSFLSDRSLSKHLYILYIYINYIYLIIWTVCVFWQWRVLLVETEFSVHFLVTGAYQTSLYPIYISIIYILSYEQCACFVSEECC